MGKEISMGRGKGKCKVEDEVKIFPFLLFQSLSSHLLTFPISCGLDEERGRECGIRMWRKGTGEEGEVKGESGRKESR